MQKFIQRPSINLYQGIRVNSETVLDFANDRVEQHLANLVFHTVSRVKGDGFESVYDTTIHLNDGDILIFEEEGRGYIKPVEPFSTIEEAIEDLTNIKDLG